MSTNSHAHLTTDEIVSVGDLDFDTIAVIRHSTAGTPYTKRISIGMPRIPPKMLHCVCYLYKSVEAAGAGEDFGGTAFLIGVPSIVPNTAYIYAVTNWHVAVRGGHSVLRINRKDGGSDTVEYGPEDWDFHPSYDIAVARVPYDKAVHQISVLPLEALCLQADVERVKIGPGDDVFMVGRFIDHDGGPVNKPAVRFGNISVMPSGIYQPNGKMADAYCIDMHSRSGYSGSPVFVYRTPGYDLEEMPKDGPLGDKYVLLAGTNYLTCLGIHFAQFEEEWDLDQKLPAKRKSDGVPLITEGAYVKGLSGMCCVLPAWTILEVLNMPKVKIPRDENEERLRAEGRHRGVPRAEGATAANAMPTSTPDAGSLAEPGAENPDHREDFRSLVSAASKKQRQDP